MAAASRRAVLGGSLALLAGCGRGRKAGGGGGEAPRDDLGRLVRLEREPQRIVSLMPANTETLYALGAGPRLVGRDDFSDHPPEARALPSVGGLETINVERVLALTPDLVVCSEFGAQAVALERAGLTVWAGSAQSYDEVFAVTSALGRLVGRAAEAEAVGAALKREVGRVEGALGGRPPVRVYYEIDATPYTVGPRSFVGTLIAKAGGRNVVPEGLGDFPKIAPELVVSADPEVMVGLSLGEARARPGWGAIAAVRAGRVRQLTPEERTVITRPGPRLGEGLRILAEIVHPGALG
ncbi:MAG TPA: ABC transporter substrate-binding protein [Polyangiaceae bacterium]|nr:ABC transporter substrate-binding protein [Polyangiaceae bacterium]